MDDNAETRRDLERMKLTQRCPSCGFQEAAGFACTRCGQATGPADWTKRPGARRRPRATETET